MTPDAQSVLLAIAVSVGFMATVLIGAAAAPRLAVVLMGRVRCRATAAAGDPLRAEAVVTHRWMSGPVPVIHPIARIATCGAFVLAVIWGADASLSGLAGHGAGAAVVRFACWVMLWFALLTAALCDAAARVIPWETCFAIAGAGSALQLVSCGLASLFAGVVFGVVVALLCAVANRIGNRLGRGSQIGGGDVRCMVALSLASGPAAFAGFAACFLVVALFAFAGRVLGKLKDAATVPLAPFFCVWLWVGAGGVLV